MKGFAGHEDAGASEQRARRSPRQQHLQRRQQAGDQGHACSQPRASAQVSPAAATLAAAKWQRLCCSGASFAQRRDTSS